MNHKFEPSEKWKANFWSKVDRSAGEDGCWLWTASKNHGYGQVQKPNSTAPMGAHKASFLLSGGVLTEAAPWVLHRCHDRACVRPDHLYAGDAAQNSQDMVDAGRSTAGDKNPSRIHPERVARGERHGSKTRPDRVPRGDRHSSRTHPELMAKGEKNGAAKITSDDVLAIRTRLASGEKHREIGASYGVSRSLIGKIFRGQIWKHTT